MLAGKIIKMSIIYQDDPQALEKLALKLADLEKQQKYWKSIKKCKPRKFDNSPEDQKWYMLTSVTNNIREVKKKIVIIEERKASGKILVRNDTFKNKKKCFFYTEVKKEPGN